MLKDWREQQPARSGTCVTQRGCRSAGRSGGISDASFWGGKRLPLKRLVISSADTDSPVNRSCFAGRSICPGESPFG